jgi:parallel beta-helix repeat protein
MEEERRRRGSHGGLEGRSSRWSWTLLGSNGKENAMKFDQTMQTTGTLAFLGVVLCLRVAFGASAPPMDVQCGDVLEVDGGQYRLNGDLVCPAEGSVAALTITGDGIHFNLRGYTITRDDDKGRSLTQGIAVMGEDVHINGGSVVGIDCPALTDAMRGNCAAIRLFNASGVRINGMSLNGNIIGVALFTGDEAQGARIHGNDITGNLRLGIVLNGSADGARITGNDLSDTGGFAPVGSGTGYEGASTGVSLIGNVANNCALTGIRLFGTAALGPAQGNTVRGNTTLNNGGAGIVLLAAFAETSRPRDNLIQSNTAFGNGNYDLGEVLFTGAIPATPFADCRRSLGPPGGARPSARPTS